MAKSTPPRPVVFHVSESAAQRLPASTTVAPLQPPGEGRGSNVRRKEMHAAVAALSARLPAAPAEFDPERRYRIKVVMPVPVIPGDDSHILRPGHLIVVSGAFAQSIRQFISGAQAL